MNFPVLAALLLFAMILLDFFKGGFFFKIEISEDKPEPENKIQPELNQLGHPFRTPAKIDSYDDVKPLPTPKPAAAKKKKEPFVMPKAMQVFMYLLPAMIVDIGMGFLFDSTQGTGVKVTSGIAAVIFNFFFIISAINRADQKS